MLKNLSFKRFDFANSYKALETLKAGDLIFSQSTSLADRLIQWSSHSPWNHVSMCIETPDGKKCILEASPGTYITEHSGIRIFTVEEFALYLKKTLQNEFMKTGEHRNFLLGIASLESPLINTMKTKIYNVYLKIQNYKYSYRNAFFAWFDGWDTIMNTFQLCGRRFSRKREEENNDREGIYRANNEDKEKYFFCSQLIVYMLRNSDFGRFKTIDAEYTVGNLADIDYLNRNLTQIKYKNIEYVIIDTLIY